MIIRKTRLISNVRSPTPMQIEMIYTMFLLLTRVYITCPSQFVCSGAAKAEYYPVEN